MVAHVVREGAIYRHIGKDGRDHVSIPGDIVEIPAGAPVPAELMESPQAVAEAAPLADQDQD